METNSQKPVIAHLISEFMQSKQSFTYRQFINHTKYEVIALSRFYFKVSREIFPVDELHYLTSIGHIYDFCDRHFPKLLDVAFDYFLKYWVVARHIELLHIHFGTFGAKLAHLRDQLQIPFVVSFYGSDTTSYPLKPEWQPLYKEMFAKVDCFLMLSEIPRRQLIAFGAPAERCLILPPSVDLSHFTYIERVPSEEVKFLITARFVEKKGHFILLEAFKNVVTSGRLVKLMIIGHGDLYEKIKDKISAENLDDFVELIDVTGIADFHSFILPKYHGADVFVLPSIVAADNDQEGTPLTILEASATGLPIISTNVAGVPEVVQDSVTGFVIPQKDVAALTEKMNELYDHPEVRLAFGKAGRQFMADNFSTASLPERLDKIYLRFLK